MMNRNILHPMMFETPIPHIGGIYWNSQLGLISLSSDNETWITLADKNLGATKVSDGSRDSIWEGAGGHYYQWGNNHGFPFSGTFQTSSDKVDASNYGPYYYGDVWKGGPLITWLYPPNPNLRGGVTNTPESKKGPCSQWFHVPTSSEFSSLLETMEQILGTSITNGEPLRQYLKIPYNGYCPRGDWGTSPTEQGIRGHFWFSDSVRDYGNQSSGCIDFDENNISMSSTDWLSHGFAIRPFKNESAMPDDSWVILYDGGSGKGIYWSPAEQIISLSSDGSTWLTIADRNLGATQIYSIGDTLSQENCGGYFQRGNCYMFPFTGPVKQENPYTRVNATNYGPYYNSDIYITGDSYDWSSSNNNNLWGGITDTLEARRGPCEEGFHIPLHLDFQAAIEVMANLGIDTSNGACLINYLKIPPAGYRLSNGELLLPSSPMLGNYRTSSPYDNGAWCLFFQGPYSIYIGTNPKVLGLCIRPFKNTPVIPDETWTKLY